MQALLVAELTPASVDTLDVIVYRSVRHGSRANHGSERAAGCHLGASSPAKGVLAENDRSVMR